MSSNNYSNETNSKDSTNKAKNQASNKASNKSSNKTSNSTNKSSNATNDYEQALSRRQKQQGLVTSAAFGLHRECGQVAERGLHYKGKE